MQAEEGDFVNLEIAFAYRGRSTSKTLKERTKDMHLYLAFYLPGNIKVPVWVNLQGIIGTVRVRLQLTPDPPFFALCTMTFLGQPKVNLSCIPLSKHGLNIMDVPFISNFVQSAVDAAMAEFVAPKSLTLDLKDMLAGDDFKKDTTARGVLMINIRRGYDFKMGDTAIPLISDGSSDPYVSVGWAKFGKAVWSTRILISEMEPYWDETCFLLVTPDELNIDERLRLQLWDSDRMSADDDLGRIEVDLKELMKNDNSNGKMWDRTDGFRALKSGDNMPGKLEWSVGYFSKARMQACQFDQQTYDKDVRNMDQLKEKVNSSSERKLRETMFREGQTHRDTDELKQLEAQEFKEEQDAMMISAPPPKGLVSGILGLQIHNITGLELEKLSKSEESKGDDSNNEEETGDDLPSAFCTVIVNHRKTFKTRTKPHNAKPFFNAGCERFIRDWTNCEVYVAVRDARVQEDDALLGIVHLPLQDLLKDRSQVNGFWPLSGGGGHGRIRLSLIWRSVQLQAPTNLLGWQYGTVEVHSGITSTDCPENLRSAKLKLKTNISKRKMRASSEGGTWHTKNDSTLSLAVEKRYSSCMSIALKTKGGFTESTSAFCVLWLKDIPDEKEQEIELPIWQGDFKRATACSLDKCGERQGTLKLKLSFWPGLVSSIASKVTRLRV
jgi:Ca2+-dependent lipid-binding protein